MRYVLETLWRELAERRGGPLAFRFYLQPLVAIFLASRDGLRDARAGRPAWLWSVFTDRVGRRELLRDAWRSVAKVFLVAVAIDVLYQLLVLRTLRPVEGLIVAIAIAIVPYAIVRGPVNRIARAVRGRTRAPTA